MKLHTKLTLGLVSSLFAVSLATAANSGAKMGPYHAGMDCNGMGMMSGDMKMDPVARAQQHLIELNAKLNLTADQQPAWKTFSERVNDQAKNMVAIRDQMEDNDQSLPKKTAPERMAKMADFMKDRAQNMARMADAVKTFYATLTAEQQATFDKIQMSKMGRKQ